MKRRRKVRRSPAPPPPKPPPKPSSMTFSREEQAMLDRAFPGYVGGTRSLKTCKISLRPD